MVKADGVGQKRAPPPGLHQSRAQFTMIGGEQTLLQSGNIARRLGENTHFQQGRGMARGDEQSAEIVQQARQIGFIRRRISRGFKFRAKWAQVNAWRRKRSSSSGWMPRGGEKF